MPSCNASIDEGQKSLNDWGVPKDLPHIEIPLSRTVFESSKQEKTKSLRACRKFETNRIYNEDCVDALKSMPDDFVDYVLTSPPYNIGGKYTFYDDNRSDYYNFLVDVTKELLRVTKKHVFFNIQYTTGNKTDLFEYIGFFARNIKDVLIWEKPVVPAYHSNVLSHNYEFFFVLTKDASTRTYDKDFGREGKKRTCFKFPGNSPLNKERFKCEVNIAIMGKQVARHIISTFTEAGCLVLDPFMGSGTTAVVCKELGRDYLGFEIDPAQINIALERLSQTTLLSNLPPLQAALKKASSVVTTTTE